MPTIRVFVTGVIIIKFFFMYSALFVMLVSWYYWR